MPAPPSLQPLYLITDGGLMRKRGLLLDYVEAALRGARGSIGFVQLREKGTGEIPQASRDELELLVPALSALCGTHGAALLLNRVHMACLPSLGNSNPNDARRFDGVQAGGSIESIAEARSLLSIKSIIGYSAHSLEEALQAERAGADLILLAPIYSPYSKRVGTPPLGASALGETARKLSIPLFALGGVSLETVGPLAQSGATGIAAITSFLPDPRAASFDANEVESKASRIAELWFERRIAHRVPA